MEALEKPFICPECGASFTNEDRLSVHLRKHDMVLQLEAKGTFVADQTPTPTRFIRNCEEVGLFQDLQNVNPFDETFKRAMETRTGNNALMVDNNLSSIDDTLHTPHIFPHLSDNNYSTKADDKINLNDSNNDKPPPRLKLMRQDSIDLIDNDNGIRLTTPIISSNEISPLDIETVNNSRKCDTNNLNNIQVPIIAITESDRDEVNNLNKNDKQLCDKDIENQLKGSELLSLPINNFNNSTKQSFSKIFSQKSIDLALDNFQNEANDKTVDLHNISIDELPHLDEINHDTSIAMRVNDSNKEKSIDSNISIMIQTDSFNTIESSCIVQQVPKTLPSFHPVQIPPSIVNKTVIEENYKKQKEEDKGYELLLKWPDGKKVYLKEVFREGSEVKQEKEQLIIESNNEVNDDIKQKLKKVIQGNLKRPSTATETVNSPNKVQLSVSKTLPNILSRKNYLTPNFQPLSIPTNSFVASQINRQKIVNNSANVIEPKNIYLPINASSSIPLTIQTISNPTMIKRAKVAILKKDSLFNDKTDIKDGFVIKPIVAVNVKNNKSVKHSTNKNTKTGSKKTVNNKNEIIITNETSTETEVEIKKERNKAAVFRYRYRKKMLNEMLTNKNNILEMENKNLKLELTAAKNEIKRLLEVHKDCSISNAQCNLELANQQR